MEWKFLKLISAISSIIGMFCLFGDGPIFTFGLWAIFGGLIVFAVCRIFEPTIVKQK